MEDYEKYMNYIHLLSFFSHHFENPQGKDFVMNLDNPQAQEKEQDSAI